MPGVPRLGAPYSGASEDGQDRDLDQLWQGIPDPSPTQALEHTLFLMARSRSRTDVPLYDRNLFRSTGREVGCRGVPIGSPPRAKPSMALPACSGAEMCLCQFSRTTL